MATVFRAPLVLRHRGPGADPPRSVELLTHLRSTAVHLLVPTPPPSTPPHPLNPRGRVPGVSLLTHTQSTVHRFLGLEALPQGVRSTRDQPNPRGFVPGISLKTETLGIVHRFPGQDPFPAGIKTNRDQPNPNRGPLPRDQFGFSNMIGLAGAGAMPFQARVDTPVRRTPAVVTMPNQPLNLRALNDGGASYTAQGVNFDGTNDYMSTTSLTGLVDGKAGIVSFWFRMQGGDGNYHLFLENTAQNFQIHRDNGNRLQIRANNSSAVEILQLSSTTLFTAGMGWTHVLASWDLAANYGALYVNNVSDILSNNKTNDTIDYNPTATDWTFGHRATGSLILNADVADFYFNPTTSLDLSVAGNRAKFISGGHPVDLGSDGSTPTGSAPIIYLHGSTASWHTNDGSGGGFTLTGGLTNASSNP